MIHDLRVTYLVAVLVPITNKQGKFSSGNWIWDCYHRPLCNIETPKTTNSPVQFGWREVVEGSNLIFGLKPVCPVCVWRNRAICSQHSVLPGGLSLFDPVPDFHTEQKISPMRRSQASQFFFKIYNHNNYQQKLSPCNEERLIQLVNDINDYVVIGRGFDCWARKLTIDKDTLHKLTRTFKLIKHKKYITEIGW